MPAVGEIQKWARFALNAQNIENAEFTLVIATQDEMQALNHQYRKKNQVTNVLSFPFEAPLGLPDEAKTDKFLGDIIICPDRLAEEATAQQKVLEHHWCHILIHGILHLLGYDHNDDAEANKMESLEISLLKQLNIANPYLEK